ncbi:MAG: hypothetical protein RMY16_12115 [Nostoc sp. DedQUE12b]|uniref:hypothetical protein n=1 Tax=Nostoc sp. DedQUE12b TaxID=3075398 RepID=UPI002AD57A32|nr:hypothetical protein [Nostoc sp. DedQUE12b]MDZ8086289.1 hypothetical protein [Nostoc sp. DedQUE12b]
MMTFFEYFHQAQHFQLAIAHTISLKLLPSHSPVGDGGIGKTSLAAKLVQDLQDEFEFMIWRSLDNAPQLKELLGDIVPFLSRQ